MLNKSKARTTNTDDNVKSVEEQQVQEDDEFDALLGIGCSNSNADCCRNLERWCQQQQLQKKTGPQESYTEHFSWLFSSVMALVGCKFINQLAHLMTVSIVGHLGAKELAGLSLAQMLEKCGAGCFLVGMTSALDTLCGQAWTGAKDKTFIGLYLQRAIAIYTVMVVPIFTFWAMSLHLLRESGTDADVAHYAGVYLLFYVPGMLALAGFHMCGSFLQAQGIMRIGAYGAALSLPVTATANYIFVTGRPFKWGVSGAALADSMNPITIFTLVVSYTVFVTGRQGWGGWASTKSIFSGWWPIIRLAASAFCLNLFNSGIPQMCTLTASRFGTTALAAYFILLRTDHTFSAIGYALKYATITRIGNLMGQGSLADAKRAIVIGSCLATCIGMAPALVFLVFRQKYPYIYTNDDAVAALVSEALPVVALKQLLNPWNCFIMGICDGLGRQRVEAVITFVCYFVIGIPLGYISAFKWGWSIFGLWAGLVIAESVLTVILSLHLCTLNWSKESRQIKNCIVNQQRQEASDNNK
ncbi:mate-domain-containing protein [Zychaea mexicana]|uniref:mate-domain-containing protein n=1 Tax=Zychaea mexicana TaxID=64656 RepID=UPI0022FF3D50|nr:mate-domain-containing protein [Zychaea mexicana]KAI9494265.1 mate-domain-containing protein [Zychaea mexicana]